ncbi:MAG: HNH endonuclease [Nitrospirae bacterium]|nr:HNH endonuclease [Nitrospirota bacterium]
MTQRKYPREFLARLKAVTSKRPKTVIEHILKHGFITTEDLEKKYGYKHPPRAARDVREQGIPLETFNVKNTEGRTIAAYRFAELSSISHDKLGGRKIFSKEFKNELIEDLGCKCSICLELYEERYLQVDHRVPYEVSGDCNNNERNTKEYMLLCGSCNRAKSWSCEHCSNWLEEKSAAVCQSCYWACPNDYKHIALRRIRRLDIVWAEHEVEIFEKFKERVEKMKKSMPTYVKSIIENHLKEN